MYQLLTLRKNRVRTPLDVPHGNTLSQSEFGKSAKKSHALQLSQDRSKFESKSGTSHKRKSQVTQSSQKTSLAMSMVEEGSVEDPKVKEMKKIVKALSGLLKNPPKDISTICSKEVISSIQRKLERSIIKNFLEYGHSIPIENVPVAFLEYILEHLFSALPKQMADLLPLVDHLAKNALCLLKAQFPQVKREKTSWMNMQLKVRSELLDNVISDAKEIETWYEKMQSTILKAEDDKNRQVVLTLLHDSSSSYAKQIADEDLIRISSEVNMELEEKLSEFYEEVNS